MRKVLALFINIHRFIPPMRILESFHQGITDSMVMMMYGTSVLTNIPRKDKLSKKTN